VRLFGGILGFLLFGFGLLCGLAVLLVIQSQALAANVTPLSFITMGLGVILLTYAIVPRRTE
jgi:hypothetical protein